jgi:acyl carrier protein
LANDKRIEDTVKEMMVERLFLKVRPDQISDEGLLSEELGLDSVSVFEIVVGLEEAYGITVEDKDFDMKTFADVRSIADFVRRKQAG